jgi:UDP-N-acetylmuramoyl-tripeptide--D-alanyl-D-alanine ligase
MQPIWKKNLLPFEHPDIFGISFDTRSIKPGDLFLALKGKNCDGHDFVKEAMKKGASCALVERVICENNIVVTSVMDELKQIALLRKSMIKSTIFAITGSVGKTTSKEALLFFLRQSGKRVFGPEKSFNTPLGVFCTLAQMPLDIEYLVLEIGTDTPGDIDELSNIIRPDYSIITHIAPAHLITFKTLRNILYEKADIIKHTKNKTFFQGDTWYSDQLSNIAQKHRVNYAQFEKSSNPITSLQNGWKLMLHEIGLEIDPTSFNMAISGRKDVFNIMLNGAQVQIIDSSYNANPASMLETIEFARTVAGNLPKIAILFSMTGIGPNAKRYHEILSTFLNDFEVLLLGEEMKFLFEKRRNLGRQALWFETIQGLYEYIEGHIKSSCCLLVKGSRNTLAPTISWLKQRANNR